VVASRTAREWRAHRTSSDRRTAFGSVDEISYRRHHRYLTTVADHATGAIVWCQPGRNSATLTEFFDELGARKRSIRAVSIDMSGEYQRALRQAVPHAEICFDPFHVVRLAGRATDQVRRDEWNLHERSHTPHGRWVKSTRWSLLKAPERQTVGQLATLWEVQNENRRLYRAFLLREELRLLYHLPDPDLAPAHLDAWLAWAARSRLRPFVRLAGTSRSGGSAQSGWWDRRSAHFPEVKPRRPSDWWRSERRRGRSSHVPDRGRGRLRQLHHQQGAAGQLGLHRRGALAHRRR